MENITKLKKEVEFLRKHVDSKYLEQWSNLQELEQYNLKQKEVHNNQTNDGGLNILQLPNEILVKIFSYLSRQDILRCVSMVCKKFKTITHADQMQEIFVNGYDYPINFNDFILQTLEHSKNWKKLNISCHSKYTDDIVKFTLKNCPKLSHIELDRISIGQYFSSAEEGEEIGKRVYVLLDCTMKRLAKYGQGITHMSVMPQDIETQWGLSQITSLKNLKTLCINGCKHSNPHYLMKRSETWTKLTTDDLISLANNCKNLEDLDLGEIGFVANHNWENAFMELLRKRQKTLKALALSNTGDDFEFNSEWYQTLSLCSNLEKLSFHFFHDEMNYR